MRGLAPDSSELSPSARRWSNSAFAPDPPVPAPSTDPAADAHVEAARELLRASESVGRGGVQEVEGRVADLERLPLMMGEHHDGGVEGRLLAPPAAPAVVRPWPALGSELVPAHDLGADAVAEVADQAVLEAVRAHPGLVRGEAGGRESPAEQRHRVDVREGRLQRLVLAGADTAPGDAEVLHADALGRGGGLVGCRLRGHGASSPRAAGRSADGIPSCAPVGRMSPRPRPEIPATPADATTAAPARGAAVVPRAPERRGVTAWSASGHLLSPLRPSTAPLTVFFASSSLSLRSALPCWTWPSVSVSLSPVSLPKPSLVLPPSLSALFSNFSSVLMELPSSSFAHRCL